MSGGLRAVRSVGAAVVAAVAVGCALAPPAGAADWLPPFDLGATGVRDVAMTPGGDVVFLLDTDAGPVLRFRSAGGPLGPSEQLLPGGAESARVGVDRAGNAELVWTRAGAVETRVRRVDGSVTDVQTVQASATSGSAEIAVAPDGRAVIAWIAGDSGRAAAARTRAIDGTLGTVQTFTVAAEKTREIALGIDAAGNATFAWTTPEGPPNTKVKARRLAAATQTLSGVIDISIPPAPGLSDTPRVAVDPAGNATIAWRHLITGASLVETRQLSAVGALGGTQVLTSPGFTSQSHSVAVDDAGRARVVWVEHTAGGMDPFLPITCTSTVGTSCGARLPLSTSPALATGVALGPAGDAVVGYASPSPAEARVIPRPGGGGVLAARILGPAAGLPQLAVDGEGNGVAAWAEDGAAKAAGFDNAGPVLQGIAIPPTVERGEPVAATAGVRDVWGAGVRWSFGDGGTADGAAVQHTFTRTGSFEVRVTATDGLGATASAAATVAVVDTKASSRDTRAPALGRVTMRRTRFRVAPAATPVTARARTAPRGSDLRFSLGEDAVVAIAVQRRTTGRRVGRTCRKAPAAVPRARRCALYVSAGRTLSRRLAAGKRRVAFSGRIGRRALRPGRYRVRVGATDAAGNRSAVRTAAFRIVR